MGARSSRVSKEEQLKKELVKQTAMSNKREKLMRLKSQIIMSSFAAITDKTVNNDDKRADTIKTVSNTVVYSTQHIIDIAINQIDRGDKPLVKADLIAIVLRLAPEMFNRLPELQSKFTVADLNALIRTLIYDPDNMQQISEIKQLIDIKDKSHVINNNHDKPMQITMRDNQFDIIE